MLLEYSFTQFSENVMFIEPRYTWGPIYGFGLGMAMRLYLLMRIDAHQMCIREGSKKTTRLFYKSCFCWSVPVWFCTYETFITRIKTHSFTNRKLLINNYIWLVRLLLNFDGFLIWIVWIFIFLNFDGFLFCFFLIQSILNCPRLKSAFPWSLLSWSALLWFAQIRSRLRA